MIYLDNAATTMHKPKQVIQAVVDAMDTMGNSARGAHAGALTAARAVYHTRAACGAMFGCPPERVAFTCNSTEALNMAICGLLEPGDHVIATDLEHNSVLRPLYRLEAERGVSLSFVAADRTGQVDYGDFERQITPRTKLIVCNHASNLTGNLLDIGRVGALAHKRGLLFLVDASQTAGCIPIHMEQMHIDVLCFTGHKGLMGPQGTGGLCAAPGVEIRPWKVGGSGTQTYSKTHPVEYPTRLEAGTLNGHGLAGLGAALDYIQAVGLSTIHKHELALMERFYQGVRQTPGVTVYGDFTGDRAAIVALNIRDYDSGAVANELSETYGICTRAGAHCAPRMHLALGTERQGAVRFSFGWFNTPQEVDAAIRAVQELAE